MCRTTWHHSGEMYEGMCIYCVNTAGTVHTAKTICTESHAITRDAGYASHVLLLQHAYMQLQPTSQ